MHGLKLKQWCHFLIDCRKMFFVAKENIHRKYWLSNYNFFSISLFDQLKSLPRIITGSQNDPHPVEKRPKKSPQNVNEFWRWTNSNYPYMKDLLKRINNLTKNIKWCEYYCAFFICMFRNVILTIHMLFCYINTVGRKWK